MSAATDRNKAAVKRGALTLPRKQPANTMGQKLDQALSKMNRKSHRSS